MSRGRIAVRFRRGNRHGRRLHLRRDPHPDRPLRRRVVDDPRRRPRRRAGQGADEPQPVGRLDARRRRRVSAARTRRARTTATSPACRRCSRACRSTCRARRSTGCAARGWTRSAPRRVRSPPATTRSSMAGGVESMSRAPFVMPKAETAFARANAVYDTTIGWRFVNKLMKERYGVDSMPETGENVATDFKVGREDQDRFALASQAKAARAQADGTFAQEITPVAVPVKKGDPLNVDRDEHPRATTMDALAKLKRDRAARRHGHGRQRVRRQRRRVCGDRRERRGREGARTDAEGPHRRHGDRRRAAADHGHRPRARVEEAARTPRADDRPDGRDRAQRGVREPGHRGAARARRRPTTIRASTRTAARSRSAIRSA